MKSIKDNPITKKKSRKTWNKRVEVNGISKSIDVEELDNGGYLVRTNKYGNNSKGKYIDETQKFYSENNPLEETDNELEELSDKLLNGNISLLMK